MVKWNRKSGNLLSKSIKKSNICVYISFQRYKEIILIILFRIPTIPGLGTDALMVHSLILIWMGKGMPCILTSDANGTSNGFLTLQFLSVKLLIVLSHFQFLQTQTYRLIQIRFIILIRFSLLLQIGENISMD